MLALILSIIGCAVSFTSLVLHFYKFLCERSKIKIEFRNRDSIFFNKIDSYETYNTDYHCLIYMTIINKSLLPVTIYDIEASLNGNSLYFQRYNGNELRLLAYTAKDRTTDFMFDLSSQYELPLDLNPYAAYKGYLFIPLFKGPINEKETIELTIKTSRKAIKTSCTVKKHIAKIDK